MKNKIYLDCTLRDGGYYNQWDFDIDFVTNYLNVMSKIHIDYVELGFRFTKNENYLGPYAFTSDNFLSRLKIPKTLKDKIGVMINAKEFILNNKANTKLLDKHFCKAKDSKVSLVRVASDLDQIHLSSEICKALKQKGYFVGLNLMKISVNTDKIETLELNNENFDVFYVADSFGGLTIHKIAELYKILSNKISKPLGIHCHNNLNIALSLTTMASSFGFKWLDSTLMGMGRGPGNTKTEDLIINKVMPWHDSYVDLTKFNNQFVKPLFQKYKWGSDILYKTTALLDIHPTYAQILKEDNRYSYEKSLATLVSIPETHKSTFKSQNLTPEFNNFNEGSHPQNTIKTFKEKDVLIIGPGIEINRISDEINEFISSKNLLTIFLNNTSVYGLKPDFRIFSDPQRILLNKELISNSTEKIIAPHSVLNFYGIPKKNHLNYNIKLSKDKIQVKENGCTLPSPLVLLYCLCLMTSSKANKVYLAGLNSPNDKIPNIDQINHCFRKYLEEEGNIKPVSITPTTLPISTVSPYYIL